MKKELLIRPFSLSLRASLSFSLSITCFQHRTLIERERDEIARKGKVSKGYHRSPGPTKLKERERWAQENDSL